MIYFNYNLYQAFYLAKNNSYEIVLKSWWQINTLTEESIPKGAEAAAVFMNKVLIFWAALPILWVGVHALEFSLMHRFRHQMELD